MEQPPIGVDTVPDVLGAYLELVELGRERLGLTGGEGGFVAGGDELGEALVEDEALPNVAGRRRTGTESLQQHHVRELVHQEPADQR